MLMSVAITVAPSAANRSAVARPMPCAAAVISIFLAVQTPAHSASLCHIARAGEVRHQAPVPKVHGATSPQCFTRLVSAPSFGVAMVTMSPTLWVKPCPSRRDP
jgi:hypothetical protein